MDRVRRRLAPSAGILLVAVGTTCGQSTRPTLGAPAQLVLSPDSVRVVPGYPVDLEVVVLTEAGDTAQADVIWGASAGNVASQGQLGGLHLGRYENSQCGDHEVTATSQPGGASDTASVTVTCEQPGPVASVTVAPKSVTLQRGATIQLRYTLEDQNGVRFSGPAVSWTTSDPAVATVDQDGLVTTVAEGFVTITATSDGVSGTSAITVSPGSLQGTSTTPNLKVAFVGDQGAKGEAVAVLELIRDEGADMVLHQGDFDYEDDPTAWDNTISSVLGSDFPYFASVGNHDDEAFYGPGGYQQRLKERLSRIHGATCSGDLGVNSACDYEGLFFILSGVGTLGSGHESYLEQQLSTNASTWQICSWHKNQTAMQVGGKDDDVGWAAYETCRERGAIIATAHEHSYSRTKTLVSIQNQTVDPEWPDPASLRVMPGATFVFVSGLGGKSIRDQERCLPTTYPYGCNGEWAMIYTSDQDAQPGVLFIEFHVTGAPNRARGYFKNVNGEVIDEFAVTAN